MTKQDIQPFSVLKKETVLQEPYAHIEKESVQFPNGKQGTWWRFKSNDAVIICAITPENEVILERAYKHGCKNVVHELPAGQIDDSEDALTAAKRELAEETGFTAEKWVNLGVIWANPTSSDMKYHLFLAQGCQKTEKQKLDDAEQIEIVTLGFEKAEQWLFSEENMASCSSMGCFYKAKDFFYSSANTSAT